jgi:hypothetical protein
MEHTCAHCGHAWTGEGAACPECGFPHSGSEKEKLRYNLELIDLRHLLAEAGKSVRGLLSMGMFFLFLLAITGLYGLWFRQVSGTAMLVFSAAAVLYFALYRLAQRRPYPALVMALLLYLAHTLYEFQTGLVPAEAEGLKGQGIFGFITLVNRVLPFIYIVLRIALTVVIGRGVWLYLKIRKFPARMVHYAERQEAGNNKQLTIGNKQ